MDTFSTFIDMGGYAAFVWPSYALALLGLGGILFAARRSVTSQQAELDRLRPPSSKTTSEDDVVTEPSRVSLDKGPQTRET